MKRANNDKRSSKRYLIICIDCKSPSIRPRIATGLVFFTYSFFPNNNKSFSRQLYQAFRLPYVLIMKWT